MKSIAIPPIAEEMRWEWYAAPDESAWSDFFRQSPWEAWMVEEAIAAFTFRDMLTRAAAAGAPPILYTSFDDSLTGKDKGTTALDGVDWHHDHTASGGGHYRNGMQLADAVRSHWGIENSRHWVLDVSFREDACRIRKDHAPENFGILRHMALNLLSKASSTKRGMAARRKKAAWDDSFLIEILTQ
jgi:hypothetical protein